MVDLISRCLLDPGVCWLKPTNIRMKNLPIHLIFQAFWPVGDDSPSSWVWSAVSSQRPQSAASWPCRVAWSGENNGCHTIVEDARWCTAFKTYERMYVWTYTILITYIYKCIYNITSHHIILSYHSVSYCTNIYKYTTVFSCCNQMFMVSVT